jgi:hypothetical protein
LGDGVRLDEVEPVIEAPVTARHSSGRRFPRNQNFGGATGAFPLDRPDHDGGE